MNSHGHYIVELSQRIKSLPKVQLVKRRDSLLEEIYDRRTQVQAIEQQIREYFAQEEVSKTARSELELALYNCDNFDNLSGDFIEHLEDNL